MIMKENEIRVLLVDDDEIDREALVRYVENEGLSYHLIPAKNENEALELIRKESLDVILMDYNLGTATGLDMLPHTGDIPVIVVTGSGTEEIAVEAMRRGARDYVIKDQDRNYLTVLPLTIQSVLERSREQNELDQLRCLLDDIVNSMPTMLVGVDLEKKVTRWNLKAAQATGINEQDALGKDLGEVFPQLVKEGDKVSLAITRNQFLKDHLMANTDDGETRLWSFTVYPLTGCKTEGAVIQIDDVTERVRVETMMIHSEKMLSVGGLAAGMAHELNNPLAGILHNIQVMNNRFKSHLPKNIRVAEECGINMKDIENYMDKRGIMEMMDHITNSGRRAAQIVDNLLTFSRDNKSQSAPHDLSRLLDRAVELAGNDYELKNIYRFDKITIHRDYHYPMPKVQCEPGKIQQVFFNIIKNGVQAMAKKTGNNSPSFHLRVAPEGTKVRVEIRDNGIGMSDKIKQRIFDPFFTTQEVGEGAGLGLSVSYFIVTRDHNGSMEVISCPGDGATFILLLPMDRRTRRTGKGVSG
jgi:PAS domain S-box-containing protein